MVRQPGGVVGVFLHRDCRCLLHRIVSVPFTINGLVYNNGEVVMTKIMMLIMMMDGIDGWINTRHTEESFGLRGRVRAILVDHYANV